MHWPQGQRAVILGIDPMVRPGEIHEVPVLVRLGASVAEPFKANASRILNPEHCPVEFGLLRRPHVKALIAIELNMQDFVSCIAIGDFECVFECAPAKPFSPEAKTPVLEVRESQLKAGSYLFRFVAIFHNQSEVSAAVRFLSTAIDLRLTQIGISAAPEAIRASPVMALLVDPPAAGLARSGSCGGVGDFVYPTRLTLGETGRGPILLDPTRFRNGFRRHEASVATTWGVANRCRKRHSEDRVDRHLVEVGRLRYQKK
jgi:hypothetical protein